MNSGLLIGNIAGDFLKNHSHSQLDEEVLEGVFLHRFIDSITDSNPVFKKFTSPLRDHFGRYSPVVMDVLLDHLFAKNWDRLFSTPFDAFTSEISKVILNENDRLPTPTAQIMHRMASADWLKSGKTESGIIRVFNRLSQKASTEIRGITVLKAYHRNRKLYDELLVDFLRTNRDEILKNYPDINLRIELKS